MAGDFAVAPQNRIVSVMQGLGAILPSAGNPYNRQTVASPGRAYANVTKDYGVSSRIGWTIGSVQLISISAYREYQAGDASDPEYSNLDIGYRADDGNAYRRFRTYTHETRLSGGLFGNRLDWLVGGYFAHEGLEVADNFKFGSQFGAFASCSLVARMNPNPALRDPTKSGCLSTTGRPALTAALNQSLVGGLDRLSTANNIGALRDVFDQTSTNYAFFTHNIFRITDTLSFTAGLRYTHEHKVLNASLNSNNAVCPAQQAALAAAQSDANATRRAIADGLVAIVCAGNSTNALNGVPLKDAISEGQFTGTTVLSWQATPSTLLYGSYARGYKAGGYNLARSGLALGSSRASDLRFDPETVNAFEVGVKYSSKKFSANLAGFRSSFRDFQLNTFNGSAFVVQNIGACAVSLNGADRDDYSDTGTCRGKVGAGVVTEGFELEAGAYPTPEVTFNLGYTYAHTQYRDNLVGSAAGAPLTAALFLLPGNQMSNAPRHVITSAATWTPAIGSNGLTGLIYVDSRMTSDYNTGSDLFAEKLQDGYILVNARIGIRGRDQRWALEFWGQNVLDTHYEQIAAAAFLQGRGSQSQVQQIGSPRYAVGNALTTAFLAEPRTYGVTLRSRF